MFVCLTGQKNHEITCFFKKPHNGLHIPLLKEDVSAFMVNSYGFKLLIDGWVYKWQPYGKLGRLFDLFKNCTFIGQVVVFVKQSGVITAA